MKLIPLRDGTFAKVDDRFFDDLTSMGPWRVSTRGYVVRGTRKAGQPYRVIHMHREVCRLAKRPVMPHTDHENLDKRDNRLQNLRPSTSSQNLANQRKHSNNKSGFKGVSWHKKTGKWVAQIRHEGHVQHLGLFNNAAEAAQTYNTAALRLFGEFARINEL